MNQHILEAVGGGVLPGPLLTHLAMQLVCRLLQWDSYIMCTGSNHSTIIVISLTHVCSF